MGSNHLKNIKRQLYGIILLLPISLALAFPLNAFALTSAPTVTCDSATSTSVTITVIDNTGGSANGVWWQLYTPSYSYYTSPSSTGFTNTFTGLTPSTHYLTSDALANGSRLSDWSAEVTCDTTSSGSAPGAPTLTGSSGNTSSGLSWTAPSTATSYDLYRGSTDIYTGAGTSFSDTGLTNGTAYSYHVTATNSFGTSADSNTVSVTPEPTSPPSAPVLTGTAGDGSNVLNWTSTGDSYVLKRNGVTVYSGTATTYTNTGLINGVIDTYQVTASNYAGSTASNSLSLIPFGTSTVSARDIQLVSMALAGFIAYKFLHYFVWSSR